MQGENNRTATQKWCQANLRHHDREIASNTKNNVLEELDKIYQRAEINYKFSSMFPVKEAITG